MRLLLDANVLLDCVVLEVSGLPRAGKAASDPRYSSFATPVLIKGLVAWHTLPIVAYYHGRQHPAAETADMMDAIMGMLEVPSVGHRDAAHWRRHGIADFEDALQMASAVAGFADVHITRNKADFIGSKIPVMTPEEFLAAFP